MIEAVILLCELVFTLLLLLSERRATQQKDDNNLGLFRYREAIALTPPRPSQNKGNSNA